MDSNNQEAIGYKMLLFLAKNPTVHEFAAEFKLALDHAYEIQHLHISLWQSMIRGRAKV